MLHSNRHGGKRINGFGYYPFCHIIFRHHGDPNLRISADLDRFVCFDFTQKIVPAVRLEGTFSFRHSFGVCCFCALKNKEEMLMKEIIETDI